MKKLFLFVFATFLYMQAFAWYPYGPSDIVANNICFSPSLLGTEAICTNNGMYIHTGYGEWAFFSENGLPVYECVFLDSDNLLLVCGDGSYSDGIYQFNLGSGQFTLLKYCISPRFIKYDDHSGKYYVGYENGLLVSEDMVNWEDVTFFAGKPCIEMVLNYTDLAVSTNLASPNVFWSADSGTSWNLSGSYFEITQMAYSGSELYGVFPGTSFSSGLYKSTDHGNTWEVEFWSPYISDVCCDPDGGELYVSWNNPDPPYEGIASYDESGSTAGLTFFNEGLPNTHINRIQYQMGIDMYFVMVCTDSGVYAIDFTGIQSHEAQSMISISPNPVSDEMQINLETDRLQGGISSIEIYSNGGIKVDEIEPGLLHQKHVKWKRKDVSTGIYYLVVRSINERYSQKFILQ